MEASCVLISASAMPRGDIGQRAQLDGPDQPFQHVAEQLDLFAGIAVGGHQKQVGDLPQRIQVFFRRAGLDGRPRLHRRSIVPTSLVLSVSSRFWQRCLRIGSRVERSVNHWGRGRAGMWP
jgi:hypothetical protein